MLSTEAMPSSTNSFVEGESNNCAHEATCVSSRPVSMPTSANAKLCRGRWEKERFAIPAIITEAISTELMEFVRCGVCRLTFLQTTSTLLAFSCSGKRCTPNGSTIAPSMQCKDEREPLILTRAGLNMIGMDIEATMAEMMRVCGVSSWENRTGRMDLRSVATMRRSNPEAEYRSAKVMWLPTPALART